MSNPGGPLRETKWVVWTGVTLVVVTLLAGLIVAAAKSWRAAAKPLPIYGLVADFSLTNQNGRTVSLADLQGHVWVADIIFTRCAGPCPRMTQQMKALQDALPAESEARLVTLTTDPDFDNPTVLTSYGERFGASPARWTFLTGSKPELGKLAIDSLKLTAIPKTPAEQESPADLFVHSTIFVVVDKHARLRGVFETTGEDIDPRVVQARILAAVRRLEREP